MNTLPQSVHSFSARRICQAGLNILVLLLFILLALASFRHFLVSGSARSFGILALNTLFVGLFITRRRATAESPSLPVWLLGVAGTALPLLLRPSDAVGLVRTGTTIQLTGIVLVIAGLLSLRRSFSVVAGNRGVRVGGLYRIVRHPIYSAELIALLGAVLVSPTFINWMLWTCECVLQYARARAEEDFLASDPAYCAYRACVHYRLIPGFV